MMLLNEKIALEEELDFESGVPLHLQLREILRRAITQRGAGGDSLRMPTDYELVERYGVSRVTVRNAIQSLVDEGLLVRERGRGTFVKTNQAENWIGRLMGFTETVKEAGYEPGAKLLDKGFTSELPESFRWAGLPVVWELKRLRYADDKPIAIEFAYYPPPIGKEIEKQDLLHIAMYRYLEEELGIPLSEARQTISAVNADSYEAELLNVPGHTALLSIERTTYRDDRTPVEFLKAVYRPDYFQYAVHLTRGTASAGSGRSL
ncbi:GntR family transcriptional regulator [Paenibacillus sp. J31TS4]|uniref:GntR family transcriptional regulator n=1 Tax=Paenibacillus sp. J31TS4 TaxID=2807195 RepID=UPI001BCE939C|nr:GntR family transcriptional regulator [Paenibacillus sp. J31TS4]